MLANPPSVYSPIFNPAYFDYSDSAGGKYAVLSGANNFLGTNNFNGTIELTSTGISILPTADIALQTGAGVTFLDNSGQIISREDYNVSNGLQKNIASDILQRIWVGAELREQISASGIDFYKLRDMQYTYEMLFDNVVSWPNNYQPPGGAAICPNKIYTAANLPSYITVSNASATSRCITIPNPSLVPVGTVFRVLSFTPNATTYLYISINGGNTSGNVGYTNEVFEFANAIWPNTATDVFVRNNTSLVLGQSAAFISVTRSSGAAWAQFD